ncbi:four helix bundle protein [Deferribacter autotrophicus]|uniref:Four helix bundle protein n=1 Tax=Deferribacter autotrophicus TaxID=500465 RepID=A0A5A8F2C7_9BACT|nr:four helix bundle protein [Deferribacter autotrophicus]KAA0257639.1 four helix bundle protein [Deferribacter autotrophicus]
MRNKPNFTFEDLDVWKEARELRTEIANIVKKFPGEEKYRLVDQMIRASRSITANIAEGYGRFHYRENIQFCRLARGSIFELIDHLTVALDENYIDNESFKLLKGSCYNVLKKLNSYIKYLKRQSNQQ